MKKWFCKATALLLALIMAAAMSVTVLADTGISQLTNLPTLYLTLNDGKSVNDISKDIQLPGTCSVRAEGYDDITDTPMTVKGRGNSTWTLPKKPYQIKFDSKTDLLGMGKAKKWILLANYWDKTLMRNAVTYHLANKLGNDYSVECRFVDVYINGQYRGNYLLTEKIEFDKQRINDSTDNGAVLFELEQQYRHASEGCAACFETAAGVHVTVKEPEVDETYTQDMLNTLKTTCQAKMNTMEAALTQGYDVYSKLIDVPSFIDWYIENELAKNYDAAFVTSSYCYFNSAGILHMGPVWDVDVCFGNQDVTYPGTVDNGLNEYNYRSDKGAWYHLLFQDETFVSMLKARWKEIRNGGKLQEMLTDIDTLSDYLSRSQKLDIARWPDAMQVTEVRGKGTPYFYYDDEVAYFKDWLTRRIAWLDSQWDPQNGYDNADYSHKTLATVTGAEAAVSGYGTTAGGSWSWNNPGSARSNQTIVTTDRLLTTSCYDGSHYFEVKFKAQFCDVNYDFMMIRCLGTDRSGKTTQISQTPVTQVTWATAEKDADGYATVRLKFKADTTQFVQYGCAIDAYRANVEVESVSLAQQTPVALYGDVDFSGKVNTTDALLALRAAVGKTSFTDLQTLIANVDGEMKLNTTDALLILRKSVGKLDRFAVEN